MGGRSATKRPRARDDAGPPDLLPPFLFPGATRAEQRWQERLRRERKIRGIGPRLYTSLPAAKVADAVRGSWMSILDRLFPGALISHRTALELRPTTRGEIFLTGTTNREIRYPGLRLRFGRGPAARDDDFALMSLRQSSPARAFLENLTARAGARALPVAQLEQRLERILRDEHEGGLLALRDHARAIADDLGWQPAFRRLDGLIGTLLGTRSEALRSDVGRARAAGEPFAPACVERLQLLFAELRNPVPQQIDGFTAADHTRNKAFFEAYFSNYIEGTTFEIEEAERIIFDHEIPRNRPKDAHDIIGTHRIVGDRTEMSKTPRGFDEMVELLRGRHHTMMKQRLEASPGEFKNLPNRAGDTTFVEPPYVIGTLRKGWELYRELPPGMARAIFIMFLVADVHPFVDGNGRAARIMMNAELVSVGASTIIIPTVYRDDYLQALRALTRRHRPTPLVDMMVKAQRFSTLQFSPYPVILKELERRNWFREPDDARIIDDAGRGGGEVVSGDRGRRRP